MLPRATPLIFGNAAPATARARALFSGPVVSSPALGGVEDFAVRRRVAFYGGSIARLGTEDLGFPPPAAPFRPGSVNRPWAGRYPWYHGGWSGWGAWPAAWGARDLSGGAAFYNNPFVVLVPASGAARRVPLELSPELRAALDYSRPIQRVPRDVRPEVVEAAQARLEAGRSAFKRGNYSEGLRQAERGIGLLPGDANLHEFRALGLFALGRYGEAAQALHAVLSAEPGWNWETMSPFYPDTATYTAQLRDLEAHVEENEEDAAARFVLAYHYLVLDERAAALEQLREVARREPDDRLSASLVESLEKATKKR